MTSSEKLFGRWSPVSRERLDNGLQLLIVEEAEAVEVVCQLHVHGAGGYFDPPDAAGRAQIAVAVAHHSWQKRLDERLVAEWPSVSRDVRVKASCDGTVATFECTTAAARLPTVVAMIATLVVRPQMAADETDETVRRMRDFRERQLQTPLFLADELLAREMAGPHPASRLRIPIATLESCPLEPLAAFARDRYVPNQSVLVITGPARREDVFALVSQAFGDWVSTQTTVPSVVSAPEPRRAALVVNMESRDTHFRLATFVGRMADRETGTGEVLCRLLDDSDGGGRLCGALPNGERATGWSCGINTHKFGGTWSIHGDMPADESEMRLPALFAEVSRLREANVDSSELEAAKSRVIAQYAEAVEVPRNRAGAYVFAFENDLGLEYWSRLPERIMSITAQEVRDVAQKYLHHDRLVAAAVGPRDPLVRVFKALEFPVTVWRQDGFELRREEDDGSGRHGLSS